MPNPAPIDHTAIARLNEHRQAAATRDLADQWVPIAGGIASYSPGVEWICHATLVGFDEDVPDAELDKLEAFYAERSLPAKLEITTIATERFLAALATRGYTVEHFENVFARPLAPTDDAQTIAPHPAPAGLAIERVDDQGDDARRQYARLVCSGFLQEPIPEEHIDMATRSIAHPRSVGFLARIEGQPAAACGMEVFEHEGRRITSLWGTTVLEPFRRRGIQQAMIAHRLAYAAARGCTLGLIESKPGIATERNAARLGLQLAYARVCMAQAAKQS